MTKGERVKRYFELVSMPEHLPYDSSHFKLELDISDEDIESYGQKMESELSMKPTEKRSTLVKKVIKPLIKKHGFTISGMDWRRKIEDGYMIIHMMNSQFNGISTKVSFHFHISAVKREMKRTDPVFSEGQYTRPKEYIVANMYSNSHHKHRHMYP